MPDWPVNMPPKLWGCPLQAAFTAPRLAAEREASREAKMREAGLEEAAMGVAEVGKESADV